MASQDLLRWRLKRRRRGRYSRNNTQWGIWLILIFLTWNIDSKMHTEETRQTIEITLWQLDFTRKILLRWRQRRPRRSSRNKHSVGLVNFHISYLSLTIFFLVKLTCHKVVITFWRVFWRNQTLCSVSTRNLSRCVNRFGTTCIYEKNNPHLLNFRFRFN